MPGPSRTQRNVHNPLDDVDLLPFVGSATSHIASYYPLYAEDLCPLSNFTVIPSDLHTFSLPNGDIVLHTSDGVEPTFDVIAVVVATSLEAPPGFGKAKFPFFCRWIKICAQDEPFFTAALRAAEVIYNFMAMHCSTVLPAPIFSLNGATCFRPSTSMLTALKDKPDAVAVEIPPLEHQQAFKTALNAGHGKFVFSGDNEVLFFNDRVMPNGEVVRAEVAPGSIRVGQIVQVKMKFRLLKQADGTFTFRQLLRAVYILNNGLSMDIARNVASQSLATQRKRNRDVKFYTVSRTNPQDSSNQDDENKAAGPSSKPL